MNQYISKCCKCGYEWQTGKDGSHSCSEHLYKDAMRWRALMKTKRIRFLGSANIGKENHNQILCIEFHSNSPYMDMEDEEKTEFAKTNIKRYVDAIIKENLK